MKCTWAIIGLGWLGQSLSEVLQGLGDDVWGTHRTSFDFCKDPFPNRACDILFLNTPPLLQLSPQNYCDKIRVAKETHVIFISSTSVYENNKGVVLETTSPRPESKNANWLLEVEILLQKKLGAQLSIIRSGGLIGGQRHPVHFLAGRSDVANGNHSVNLIHRDDLIKIILLVAQSSPYISLVNAVSPDHPLREDYYSQWAKKLGLPPINFIDSHSSDRIVNSFILADLNFEWKYMSLDY